MYSAHPVEPEEIMAYIDGELPVERASAAAAHLASCGECQRMAADFRGLPRRLTQWEVEECAVGMRVAPRRRRWVKFVGWGAGLAAAAGTLIVAVSVRPRPR